MSRLALIAAIALLAATPEPARMESCTVIPRTMDHRITPHVMIRVSFMITGDLPADLVRFTALTPIGVYREFTTHGHFTKNVMIEDREIEIDLEEGETVPGRPLPHGVDCALTYIHYVDGTSWSAPP
ncbi:MAG TPA: hypothetical protein VGI19_02030 [Candidatus Cybelea sp.]|jgi:hypothetical protein